MLRIWLEPHTLHFKRPAPTSRGPLSTRQMWLVRAADSSALDIVGIGECGPIPGLSADARPSFAEEVAALVAAINGAAPLVPTADDPMHWLITLLQPWEAELARLPSLRFGLESALLDLHSGGRGAYFPSPFTQGAAPLPTHGLIWMDTPAGLAAQVDAKVAAGFTVIKMKVGALPFDEELALLRTLRRQHPHIALRLDANGAFGAEGAQAKLEALAPLNIEFIEQPLRAGQHAALASICAQSPIPVVLDEELIGLPEPNGLRALLETVRPQGIIIKPSLLGGWRAAMAAVSVCADLGTAWWANSLLESSIGHDAICQWTAAYGGTRVHGLGTGSLYRDNFVSPIALQGSMLHRRPPAPGQDRTAIAA